MSYITEQVIKMSTADISSHEISLKVNASSRYIRKIRNRLDLPRPSCGPPIGKKNPSYKSGRIIDLDGYALVSAPLDHPNTRKRTDRNFGVILEHRLVMENKIGRYLSEIEVVDHIDGLHLHNDPDNLRIFQNNGEHLKKTITDTDRKWSLSGFSNIGTRADLGKDCQSVDTYRLRKKRGDVRLLQILHAVLKLGIKNPHLLGTTRYMVERGIDPTSQTSLKLALKNLYLAWEQDLLR